MNDKTKKTLKIFSFLFFLMALYDVIGLIVNFTHGQFDFASITSAADGNVTLAIAAIAVIVGITAAFICLKLIAGMNILDQTKDGNNKKLKRKLIVTLLIFHIIATLYIIGDRMTLTIKNVDLAVDLTSIAVMLLFLINVKKFEGVKLS
mgnify:CR=1 FL=1